MKFLILLIFIQFCYNLTFGTTLTCNFFEDSRKSYACEVLDLEILSNSSTLITQVTGNHLTNKSNQNVKYFTSQHNKIKFFPQNLQNFFPHLETFSIYNASLMKISKNDLKFTELKKLMFYYNKIEIIESNLFDLTPNLILISLLYNKIKVVEIKAFDGLQSLTLLHFHNPCYQTDAFNKRIVKKIIGEIYENCKIERENFEEENSNFGEIQEENLKNSLTVLANENQKLKIEIENLKINCGN